MEASFITDGLEARDMSKWTSNRNSVLVLLICRGPQRYHENRSGLFVAKEGSGGPKKASSSF